MSDKHVSVVTEGGVRTIVFDRPDSRNALDLGMLEAAIEAVHDADGNGSVRAVLLTGAHGVFSAGADLSRPVVRADGSVDSSLLVAANELVLAISSVDAMVVAGVQGPAVGVACSIAVAADLVVAGRSAFFQTPLAALGLMPDGGATALLPAAIGRARATRMVALGERISAETAFDWGLVSHLVDDDAYADELARLVAELAGGPTIAHARTKRALRDSTLSGLPRAVLREVEGQVELAGTADFREAARAHRDRRRPVFTGR